MLRVTGLACYPVKGCAGISLQDGVLTDAGLAHDRSFMVIRPDGTMRTQRRDPRLAVIEPAITAEGERVTLRAPGIEPVHLAVDLTAPRRTVILFGAAYTGIDQGEDVADWLGEVLRVPSRLVRVPPEHHRVTDGLVPGTSAYADSCPVHLVSQGSLDDLNGRLAGAGSPPMPMARFRPNIVVEGPVAPYVEDDLRHVGVGECELGFAKEAVRCVTTTVDQGSGAKCGPEPLRTLSHYRRVAGEGVRFGAKFAVLRTGKLAVGDEVTPVPTAAAHGC